MSIADRFAEILDRMKEADERQQAAVDELLARTRELIASLDDDGTCEPSGGLDDIRKCLTSMYGDHLLHF